MKPRLRAHNPTSPGVSRSYFKETQTTILVAAEHTVKFFRLTSRQCPWAIASIYLINMNNAIQIIHTYVRLILSHSAGQQPNNLLEGLNLESNGLRTIISRAYQKNPKSRKLEQELNRCFTKLCAAANELWLAKPTNEVVKDAQHTIHQFIDHLMDSYTLILYQTHALPLYRLQQSKNKLASSMKPIQILLSSKNINEAFLAQLYKALRDLFKDNRYPCCCYAQENYLWVFIKQLQLLAADPRKKDWERRLKQLLIKYNFNHMGVYKFLATEAKAQLNKTQDPLQVHQRLHELKVWLAQLQLIPDLAYQPEHETLKGLLLKEITLYREHFMEKLSLGTNGTDKIICNSSVNELSLFFHYLYEEGLYNYKTKKEAAIAVAQHVRSKETREISPHSLTKFDKLQLNQAAVKLYQRNRRIQERLVADFDL